MDKLIEDQYIYLTNNIMGNYVYDVYLQGSDELIGCVSYIYRGEFMENFGPCYLYLKPKYQNSIIKKSILKLMIITLENEQKTKKGR